MQQIGHVSHEIWWHNYYLSLWSRKTRCSRIHNVLSIMQALITISLSCSHYQILINRVLKYKLSTLLSAVSYMWPLHVYSPIWPRNRFPGYFQLAWPGSWYHDQVSVTVLPQPALSPCDNVNIICHDVSCYTDVILVIVIQGVMWHKYSDEPLSGGYIHLHWLDSSLTARRERELLVA